MIATFDIRGELVLPSAEIRTVAINHPTADENHFCGDDFYWIDFCLTPRRPLAKGRYVDRWGPHRFATLGSLMSLPPNYNLHLRNEGGQHFSVICALRAEQVDRWLPQDFTWTDRRLEACLDIASPTLREILLRLSRELRHPNAASTALCEALVTQLAIELGHFLVAIDGPVEQGGLSGWRLRLIDQRLEEGGKPPTLEELAAICGLSARQLTRAFRTSRGCSIGDYLRQTRIDAAKRLLGGDRSIKAIAAIVGFSSQSTFTFAFREATGLTPRQFRERVAKRLGDEPPPG